MTHFMLIRHGSTDALGVSLSGRLPHIRLNARGESEVAALAACLQRRALEWTALYTSPLERTRQTAADLGARLGLTPLVCEGLAELHFGDWTGKRFEELDADAQWRHFNDFRSVTRAPSGETLLDVQRRALQVLIEQRDRHRDGVVILVTHADVIKAVTMYILGMPLDFHGRIEIAPASITELTVGLDYACVSTLNDTSHLRSK